MRTGVLRGIVLPSAIVAAALAWAVLTGCGSGGEAERPPTPIAWVTPPAPPTTTGLEAFAPECDAEMIRVARGEAAIEQTLPSCATEWEWMGAAARYPAALSAGECNGDDALLVGTLALQGPCLYIVDPDGYSPARASVPMLLAFGIGTGWDAKSETVSYASRELRVGEVVQVGGSAVRKSAVSTQWLVPPDPECESELIWFVGEPFPAK